MKNKGTTLLAGIAALALVAGNGLASAQDNSKSESGQAACHAANEPRRDEQPIEPEHAASARRLNVPARPTRGGPRSRV
jgi:hypothetical protein